MGKETDIQWCDSTVNPTTGCDGCELWDVLTGGPCYAGPIHEGRLAKSLPNLYAPSFTEVRLAPGRMAKAAVWPDLRGVPRPGKPWIPPELPRLIFVGDMGDVFSSAVPFDYLASELIETAASPRGSRHVWQVLTKRPRRLAGFARELAARGVAWPRNVWCGTSVTNRKTLRRIDALLDAPVGIRFASLEPLRESVDLNAREYVCSGWRKTITAGAYLDQVIVGGESDQPPYKGTPFNLHWARQVAWDCRDTGTACFVKQLGSRLFIDSTGGHRFDDHTYHKVRDSHGGDWDEWPADLRVREFPEALPCPS